MIDTQLFSLFLIASLTLLLTPGPAILYIVSRSIQQGKKAGIASVLGIAMGTVIHILAATLGISLIIMQSAILFNAIKLAGAAYLIYLGIKTFRQKGTINFEEIKESNSSLRKVFIDGIIVNTFNPKTALFFPGFSCLNS